MKKKDNIRFNIIKNYLIFNKEKKTHKKTTIKNNKNIITRKNNIIKFNKNSQKIILLNKNIIKIENLNEIKIFKKINKEIFKDIKNFFIDCIYPNLNINYIKNNLSSKNKLFIKIPKNVNIKKAIHILDFSENKNQQIYIIAEENSKTDIFNYNINNNKSLSHNININIFLKKNSILTYNIIYSNKKKTTHRNAIYTKQLEQSNLKLTEISIKKDEITSNNNFFLLGKHASLEKKGGYSLKNISKCSIICKINHYENESKSKTIIKTTNKNSELQFKGNIEVGMNVENVEANLKCNGIMLSKKGNIEFIPELSINNNNVICSHEATIGHIDKNIIKYMQSRGIKEKKCITELMKIFFYEISNNNKILSKIINKN